MEEPTDAELIARSLTDPAAFARIDERYATTIYRYVMRRLGPGAAVAASRLLPSVVAACAGGGQGRG